MVSDPRYTLLKSHRSKRGIIYMQSCKKCAVPVITSMALICHIAIVVAGRAHCFHHCIYVYYYYYYYYYHYYYCYIMLEKIPWKRPLMGFLRRLSMKTQTQKIWRSTACSYTETWLQHQRFSKIKCNCLYLFCTFASFSDQCPK